MYKLSERLKELRKRNNISQNALAKQMNLTRATINAWEMGINYPTAQSLIMLADFFNVTSDYILGLDSVETINISKLNDAEKKMICDMVKYLGDIKSDM
ncbi:MAG: helix-turn-helix transcriptional regulator [Clostridia bacterium]|nr:helix-turn-helix transcriptional regulator [Clostridia bacterium]